MTVSPVCQLSYQEEMIMSKKDKIVYVVCVIIVALATCLVMYSAEVSGRINEKPESAKSQIETVYDREPEPESEPEPETNKAEEPVVETEQPVEQDVTHAQTYESDYGASYGSSYQSYGYGASSNVGGGVLTPSGGVNYYNGATETYYNLDMSGVIANAQNMGIQGEYWVREDGVKMYGDYVIVASQHDKGTIIDTSLGTGIVLDYCPAGTVDVATSW